MSRISFLALLLLFTFSLSAAEEPGKKKAEPNLDQVVNKLQKVWDETHSYQTKFKQVVNSKRLGTRDETEGTLSVVKPDKLRWESPDDGSTQIMNGKKLVLIQQNKRRGTRVVDVYGDVAKAVDTKPLRFLAGKAKFRDVYRIHLITEDEKSAQLRLTPKDDKSETLIAEIDKASYFLRSLTTDSTDSRVRIDFSGTKTNVALSDKLFEYKPNPKDVIHNQ